MMMTYPCIVQYNPSHRKLVIREIIIFICVGFIALLPLRSTRENIEEKEKKGKKEQKEYKRYCRFSLARLVMTT